MQETWRRPANHRRRGGLTVQGVVANIPRSAGEVRDGMDSPIAERPRSAGRILLAAAGALALIVAVVVVLVDLARAPVAGRLLEAWLHARGAPSSVEIIALSDNGLSARVRVGDPRDPDLTIDRLDLTYSLSGPWSGRAFDLNPRAVRVIRPRLRVRLNNGKLDFGHLNGVVQWVQGLPPSRRPLPDIAIEAGELRLVTPGGAFELSGSGASKAARLIGFKGRLWPFREQGGVVSAAGEGGPLSVVANGERLSARFDLGRTTLAGPAEHLQAARLTATVDLPYPASANRWWGPARVTVAAEGLDFDVRGVRLAGGAARAALTGEVEATGGRQSFTGALRAGASVHALSAPLAKGRGGAIDAGLDRLSVVRDPNGVAVGARGRVGWTLGRLVTRAATFTGLGGRLTLTDSRLGVAAGIWDGRARLAGGISGRGALAPRAAMEVVRALPVVSGERPYGPALAAALEDFRFVATGARLDLDRRGGRLAVARAARLDTASGAHLRLSGRLAATAGPAWRAGGATALTLAGGGLPSLTVRSDNWSANPGALRADLSGHGAFNPRAATGVEVSVSGRLLSTAGQSRFDLATCAPVVARRLTFGGSAAQAVALRLCPAAGPLFESVGADWRSRGRLEALRADAPALALGIRQGAVAFDAAGGPTGLATAGVTLDRATLVDRADPIRFWPLTWSGGLGLGPAGWRGRFAVSSASGRALGGFALAQSRDTGAGRLDIDTGPLVLARGGLQLADITPLAHFVRDASGRVELTGRLAWTSAGQIHGGGEVVARSLGFTGPSGPVTGLDADVVLTSLLPLVSAPSQRLTIASVQTITPVTDLEMLFDIGAGAVHVQRLDADFSGGQLSLEPITVPLTGVGDLHSALDLRRVNLGDLLAASNLSDRVKLRAIVDGRIPFSVGPKGVTVTDGVLAAVGGGRLSIARAAVAGASESGKTGFAQDFAYQAMENLAFDTLEAKLGSQAHDRLGILFHIKGWHDPPTPQRAVVRLVDVLRGRAFDKPVPLPSGVRIDLTLDTSLNFGDLVAALETAWRDATGPSVDHHPEGVAPGPTAAMSKTEVMHR